ncbi:MAG TPA: hypothetical protein VKQ73_02065 [Stellaceae bacterium]|nr:hypothetical protein [Stellaceae bacterium]
MPGKVEPLRPTTANAPAEHAPQRSPEREALAAAIERLAEARRELNRIAEARERAQRVGKIEVRLDELQAELVTAKAAEPERLVDALLGEESTGPSPVAEIERSLRAAAAELEQARAVRAILTEREGAARRSIADAEIELKAARGAVLRSDPAVRALFAELDEAKRRHAELERCCRAIGVLGVPPAHAASDAVFLVDDYHVAKLPAVAEWQGAVAQLLIDPDVGLPRDRDAEPPAAA